MWASQACGTPRAGPSPRSPGHWCPGQHGKGFATEGARRALRAAYEDFGWTTAVSVVSVNNPASQAVALRMGATLEREITYRHGAAHVYRHVGLAALATG
ncbi:GNAT family N-acetyltransferase [Hydrogenophaga sp. A37]|uniref:GNAT family N-acetyltransferase n=1 Tax=Hydrogenophaga sp. A37 TaxID=1945864 RepID=UPI0009879C3F|nr:GNAT family N-acetyltransferase [Hydrogenophaga sp. A37]OOG79481.1 hypothetical protein B0E41_23680 [Hydrogenophaga sp. A37]